MTSYGEIKTNEKECIANSTFVSLFAKRFPAKTHTTRTRNFLRRLFVQRSNWSTYRMAILAFNFKFLMVARIRMELEVSSQNVFTRISFLLQLVSFTVDSDPLWPTESVNITPSHAYFLAHLYTHPLRTCTCMAHKSLVIVTPMSVHGYTNFGLCAHEFQLLFLLDIWWCPQTPLDTVAFTLINIAGETFFWILDMSFFFQRNTCFYFEGALGVRHGGHPFFQSAPTFPISAPRGDHRVSPLRIVDPCCSADGAQCLCPSVGLDGPPVSSSCRLICLIFRLCAFMSAPTALL